MARSDTIHIAFLPFDLRTRSFKHQGADDHLVGFESFDFRYEELFRFALQIREYTRRLCFQRQAELELKIVQKPHACRGGGFARQVVHEFEPVVEGGKEHRPVLLNFGRRKKFYDGGSDDAERSFRAEHQSSKIEADRFARRSTCPLKLACRGYHTDIENQVLDVAIKVLLHAAGVCRNPSTER